MLSRLGGRGGDDRGGDDRGAIAIVVAAAAVMIFAFGALAVDLGNMYARRRAAQLDADLAALAGGQGLPDPAAARCLAKDYVARNLPPGGTPPLDWDYDNDPADGSIDVQTAGGSPIPGGPSASPCLPGLASSADRLTVTIPRRRVDFALAGALGIGSSSVTASATVQLRQPLGHLLPFGLPAGAGGLVCLKLGAGSSNLCAGGNAGNYQTLDIPRTDPSQGNRRLQYNLKAGVDHGLAVFPNAPADTQCANGGGKATLTGAVPDTGPPYSDSNVPNCVATQTGNDPAKVQDGLIDGKFDGSGRGRLADPGAGHAVARIAGRDNVDNDSLTKYLVAGANLPGALSGPTSPFTAAILDDPRFGIVPVFNITTLGSGKGTSYYPIADFAGVYVESIETNSPKKSPQEGQIVALKAWVFPLGLVSFPVPNTGPTGPYIGKGPKTVVLVE